MRGSVAVLILVLLAFPAGARGDAGSTWDSPGWIVFDLVGGSGPVTIEAAPRARGATVTSVAVELGLNSGGAMYSSSTVGYLGVGAGPARVGASAVSFNAGAAIVVEAGASGKVLVWSAGDLWSWRWSAMLPPDASLTQLASGRNVLFSMGEGADEGAHAHVATPLIEASVSSARYHLDIEHRFIGFVGDHDHSSDEEVTLTTPDGSTFACRCITPGGPYDAGPGLYEVEWRGIGTGRPRILYAGVDAPHMPRPWVP